MPNSAPHKKYGMLVIAAAIAIIGGFLIATKSTVDRRKVATEQRAQFHAADVAACKRTNKLYRLIQKEVRLSLTTTPKLSYYKQHPDELAAVQQRARDEVKDFAPVKCNKEGA